MKNWLGTILLLVGSLLSVPAWGQTAGDIKVQLTAEKVTQDVKRQEQLRPADQAKPGEVLQYTAVYRNESKKAVTKLQATVPIPVGTVLLADSAKPPATAGSIDGTKFAKLPLTRIAKGADGKEREETVPLREYRAVRWTIDRLEAGKEATVSVRVQVVTVAATESRK